MKNFLPAFLFAGLAGVFFLVANPSTAQVESARAAGHNVVACSDSANTAITVPLADAFGNSKNNLYYINFSNTHELDALRGQLALRGLNSVVVDIEFVSTNTGSLKYDVNACIQYYKAVQISGDSGAIATALSN